MYSRRRCSTGDGVISTTSDRHHVVVWRRLAMQRRISRRQRVGRVHFSQRLPGDQHHANEEDDALHQLEEKLRRNVTDRRIRCDEQQQG